MCNGSYYPYVAQLEEKLRALEEVEESLTEDELLELKEKAYEEELAAPLEV